jgi:hypothetical protein
VQKFVEELCSKIRGHAQKPSGRVIFESNDIGEKQYKKLLCDVSMEDIEIEKNDKLTGFLNTRNLAILNLPTTLADVFEFFKAVQDDPHLDTSSDLWKFLSYLNL